MPKGTEYKITWSDTKQAYEVEHTPFVFPLSDDSLPSWLKLVNAFHFQASTGESFTARKETKQRGTGYWYAYKRVKGKLYKSYLGETSKITLALLVSTARAFVAPPEPERAREPPEQPPRKPRYQFTKTLASALSIFGFAQVPTKVALIGKYRELVKQHHPDTGGLHEDMVAINLAYEYLKRFVH